MVRAREGSDDTVCKAGGAGCDGGGCGTEVGAEGEGGAAPASRSTMPGIAIPPRPNIGWTEP